jgi:radical SAM superfamily enzyme YgiQ (UPF0313 family)
MYSNPVYRPPSEAGSLIIQITEGCSHNKCTFCGMYKNKKFRIKTDDEVFSHLQYLKAYYPHPEKVFIADGNFLCLSTDKIIKYLTLIKKYSTNIKQISCYAGPLDLLDKTSEELKLIKEAGITMLYMGVESGSDEVLKKIKKGVNSTEMILAGKKAVSAGFLFSCMIISGLGSHELSQIHALESAKVISAINPDYFALLTLHFDADSELKEDVTNGKFKVLSPDEIMVETYKMIENINLENCVFRSNHISNYVNLRGTLNRDKDKILNEIKNAMQPKIYTPESIRRL